MNIRVISGLVVVALAISACNASTAERAAGQAEAAAARFTAAVQRIAHNLGMSSEDVEHGIRLKLPNTSVDDLATQAEKSADETDVLKQIAEAQAAAKEAEQVETFTAIHDAACDAVAIYSDVTKTQGDRDAAFRNAIAARLLEHNLAASTGKVNAVWQAVSTQFNSISTNGTFDPNQALIDFACLL